MNTSSESYNIFNNIKKIYTQSFAKKYASDIAITKIILIAFAIIFIRLFLKRNKEEIASNWKYNKCNPKYMLFSGWIKKSKDETAFEATVNNFNGCMNGILKSIIDAAFMPVLELSRIKIGEFKNIQNVYSGLNTNFSATKVQLDAQLSAVSAGLTGLTGPGISSEADGNGAESTNGGGVIFKAQYIFMDMFKKITAIMPVITHIISTVAYTIQSFFVSAYGAFNGLLIILTPIIVAFSALGISLIAYYWIVCAATAGLGCVFAIAILVCGILCIIMALIFLVIFLLIAFAALGYNEFLKLVFNVNEVGIKGAPKVGSSKKKKKKCFDGNTIIDLKKCSKPMCELNPGDILKDDSRVTAVMKCLAPKKMYKIKNILVTGDHPIFDVETNFYIPVCEHNESTIVENYDEHFVYCISTSSKTIKIGNYTFSDWDELDYMDRDELIINGISLKNHCLINGGFTNDTMVCIKIGDITRNIKISNIFPGMNLENGSKIQAIVKTEPLDTYEYINQGIKGSKNIVFKTKQEILHSGEKMNKKYIGKQSLYHIISDDGIIQINNNIIHDYDSIMETLLKNDRRHLFLKSL
tara:strand:- start:2097 stop:3845 length:1749 start_codon:yes stop_codon:yes gene_type:complete